MEDLTVTEKKVLRLIAENKTSKEIAMSLHVSYRTIENHRSNICNKLDIHGSHSLLKFAIEHKSFL
jgi:DNA-binding CsgD family transcriptional regulator